MEYNELERILLYLSNFNNRNEAVIDVLWDLLLWENEWLFYSLFFDSYL